MAPVRTQLPPRRMIPLAQGIKIWLDETGLVLRKVEFSAATVAFGHNGRVVANQPELDAALTKVEQVVGGIAVVPSRDACNRSLIDLACNFHLPAQCIVLGHSNCEFRVTVERRGGKATTKAAGAGSSGWVKRR